MTITAPPPVEATTHTPVGEAVPPKVATKLSTNAPILVSSPIVQPYRLMKVESLTSFPSLTSSLMERT